MPPASPARMLPVVIAAASGGAVLLAAAAAAHAQITFVSNWTGASSQPTNYDNGGNWNSGVFSQGPNEAAA